MSAKKWELALERSLGPAGVEVIGRRQIRVWARDLEKKLEPLLKDPKMRRVMEEGKK